MNSGVRKAAIFLSGLDWEKADDLLKRLDQDEAQTVRAEMVRLKHVSEEELAQTAESFLQTTRSPYPCTVDQFESTISVHDLNFVNPLQPHRFDFLETMDPYETASFLVDESPQMIAVVLSELAPQYSGETIFCFEQTFRMDLIRRLAKLHQTDETILDEIEQSLKTRFSRTEELPVKRSGMTIIEEMLKYADEEMEQEIRFGLDESQHHHTDEYPSNFTFDDLASFDDHELAVLYHSLNDEIAVMSLMGADPIFVSRVFYQYPVYEQSRIHELLVQYQSISQDEIEYARRCVLQGALQLISEGVFT